MGRHTLLLCVICATTLQILQLGQLRCEFQFYLHSLKMLCSQNLLTKKGGANDKKGGKGQKDYICTVNA
jgi:hypothetical protein